MGKLKHLLILIVILIFTGCATSDNILFSTKDDKVFIGESTEIQIGRNVDESLRKQYKISSDSRLNNY